MTEDEYREAMVEQMKEIDASIMLLVEWVRYVMWAILLVAVASCGHH